MDPEFVSRFKNWTVNDFDLLLNKAESREDLRRKWLLSEEFKTIAQPEIQSTGLEPIELIKQLRISIYGPYRQLHDDPGSPSSSDSPLTSPSDNESNPSPLAISNSDESSSLHMPISSPYSPSTLNPRDETSSEVSKSSETTPSDNESTPISSETASVDINTDEKESIDGSSETTTPSDNESTPSSGEPVSVDINMDEKESIDIEGMTQANFLDASVDIGLNCLRKLTILNKREKMGKIEVKNIIGSGNFADIFNICIDADCSYVLKVVELDQFYQDSIRNLERQGFIFKGKNDIEKWSNSIKLSQTLPDVYVNIIAAWICETDTSTFGITVMEHLSSVVSTLFHSNIEEINLDGRTFYSIDIILAVIDNIIQQIETGIVNVDNNFANFMFDVGDDDQLIVKATNVDFINQIEPNNEKYIDHNIQTIIRELLNDQQINFFELLDTLKQITTINKSSLKNKHFYNFYEKFLDQFYQSIQFEIERNNIKRRFIQPSETSSEAPQSEIASSEVPQSETSSEAPESEIASSETAPSETASSDIPTSKQLAKN